MPGEWVNMADRLCVVGIRPTHEHGHRSMGIRVQREQADACAKRRSRLIGVSWYELKLQRKRTHPTGLI